MAGASSVSDRGPCAASLRLKETTATRVEHERSVLVFHEADIRFTLVLAQLGHIARKRYQASL